MVLTNISRGSYRPRKRFDNNHLAWIIVIKCFGEIVSIQCSGNTVRAGFTNARGDSGLEARKIGYFHDFFPGNYTDN